MPLVSGLPTFFFFFFFSFIFLERFTVGTIYGVSLLRFFLKDGVGRGGRWRGGRGNGVKEMEGINRARIYSFALTLNSPIKVLGLWLL